MVFGASKSQKHCEDNLLSLEEAIFFSHYKWWKSFCQILKIKKIELKKKIQCKIIKDACALSIVYQIGFKLWVKMGKCQLKMCLEWDSIDIFAKIISQKI